MASVVFHAFNQIKATGKVKLFRSHKEGYKDGEQLRDFIYVEDVCNVMFWMMESMVNGQWSMEKNGIYNLGTGKARTFIDLVTPIFTTLNLPVNIEFIDMPEDIRDKYQYFTEADMNKLKAAGYHEEFFSVEKGVSDYVKNYLVPQTFY
jgi:ADP-L-glycero-D-manno-heptose 6-epimerase